MKKTELQRRDFLKISATSMLTALAAACGAQPPEADVEPEAPAAEVPTEDTGAVEVAEGPAEPPFLADRVAAGDLPPLDERLPESPFVVGGRDAIGVYGGEVRMIHFDPVWMVSNYDWNADRLLHFSDEDLRTIVGNIFESWEVSTDGKEYTFYMRKGMKYSDGAPLTTEDVRFYWEDYHLNTELNASVVWKFRFGGEPMVLDVIDDYTFKITFAAPFGNFPAHVTRMEPNHWDSLIAPSHYLKQYLPKYGDQAELEARAEELGLEGWVQLASQRLNQYEIL